MKIFVCVKPVPDTTADINIIGQNQIDDDINFIVNPYDENALEAAKRIKKQVENCEIIAITVGNKKGKDTVLSALSMAADRAIWVETDLILDNIKTVKALKKAISEDGNPDMIITGKEAIDSEGSQTMFRLAAAFGFPVLNNVTALTLAGNKVRLENEAESGTLQETEMELPCVVGVGRGLNEPEYPTLRQIMKANKKEIKELPLDQLDISPTESNLKVLEIKPARIERKRQEIEGSPTEIVEQLTLILQKEANI